MRLLIRVVLVAVLAVDAYVHLHLAGRYAPIEATISQATLFRIEAAVAILTGLLVAVWPRREVFAAAFLVLASALGAVLLYRYVNVGQLGPLPNMYEPVWFTEKTVSAYAEAIGVVAAAVGLGLTLPRPRRGR